MLRLRFTALSDVGRVRKDNQDSGYAGPHLLAIADGVGGAARGDVASSATIQQLRHLDVQPGNDALEQLAGALHLAHNRLADLVAENAELDGTSTTATVALFDGTQLALAHVGDSRGYLLRDGRLQQLTKDHTFVQSLVDEGRITDDEARIHPHRNLILRALDAVHEPEPDVTTIPLAPGDRILLCSDGCSGALTDEEMASLLGDGDIDRAAPALVTAALEAGSSDNVTVVLAEVVDGQVTGQPAATGEEPEATPIVVGAARGAVRRGLGGALRRRRQVESEEPVDPEALRYAPLPPRRLWPRRLAVGTLLLALLAGLAYAGYRYTQAQYYVGAHQDRVAIYQGVAADWSILGVELHHVEKLSTLRLADLTEADRASVVGGFPESSLSEAEAKVSALMERVCDEAEQKRAQQVRKQSVDKKADKKAGQKKQAKKQKKAAKKAPTYPSTYPGCLGER